jgi:hypothetical protein
VQKNDRLFHHLTQFDRVPLEALLDDNSDCKIKDSIIATTIDILITN